MRRNWIYLLIILLLVGVIWLQTNPDPALTPPAADPAPNARVATPADANDSALDPEGYYYSRQELARYLFEYGKLPDHFLTKSEAQALGWVAAKGNLWEVQAQAAIGGDRFYNREKRLPDSPGRIWYECDVNYQGGHRGPERLVYSNDGLIYYTPDHYKSFEAIREEDL